MERMLVVSTFEEAAAEGYRQGFEEGYTAARVVIQTIADALREQEGKDVGFDGVHALDLSREQARAMLGSPVFTISGVAVAASSSNRYQ